MTREPDEPDPKLLPTAADLQPEPVETQPCGECGEEVPAGDRVLFLAPDGTTQWRHSFHPASEPRGNGGRPPESG